MRISIALVAAALLLPQLPAGAQDKPGGTPTYKVDFNIHDGSGTARGARHYTLLTESGRKATFKVGNRVPAASGSFQPGNAAPLVNTQFTYLDIGVNIECVVGEMSGKIMLHGSLDLSSVAPAGDAARPGGSSNPTLVQTKVDLDTAIDLGKPTTIASIDDPVTTRQFQVEATITRVN